MRIGSFDLDKSIMIVAEIGNNHEGSFGLAEDMIGRAAEAGAHAVKFQTFRTEHYVSRRDEARFARLKRFELSHQEFERLSDVARRLGVIFLSTPFDLESAAFLNSIVPAFKIASGDIGFYPLLEKVAGYAKPVILSTGIADLAQVRRSISAVERVWRDNKVRQTCAVLHCVSCYPTAPSDANLSNIGRLRESLESAVGYSDHTTGIRAAVTAAALGARIIEKHFTFDKNYSDFRDHQLSADPAEFAEMVQQINEVQVLLGGGAAPASIPGENGKAEMGRSIVARRDMRRGALIERSDLDWIRPGTGLAPGSEYLLLGKRLVCDIPAGDPITADAVKVVGSI